MKEGIHPDNYRLVVFKDMSNDYAFLSKSAAETKETIQWEDGNEYPLVKVEVSHKAILITPGRRNLWILLGVLTNSVRSTGSSTRKTAKADAIKNISIIKKEPARAGSFFCACACSEEPAWRISPAVQSEIHAGHSPHCLGFVRYC